MTIYSLAISICWAVCLLVWFFASFFTKRTMRSKFFSGMAWRVLIGVALVWFLSMESRTRAHLEPTSSVSPLLGTTAVLCAALGIAFAIWARLQLGRNWGMPMAKKENPELVTSGPYSLVRHPIYTGVLLALLGSVFIAGPPSLVLFIAVFAYFSYSARKEESLMRTTFPEAYPAYMKRTKFLIPFVW